MITIFHNFKNCIGIRKCMIFHISFSMLENFYESTYTKWSCFRWKPPRRNVAIQYVSKRDSRDSISCSAVSSEDSWNKRSSSKRHSERLPLQRVHGVSNHPVIHHSVVICLLFFCCLLVAMRLISLLLITSSFTAISFVLY